MRHEPNAPMTDGEVLRLNYWGASGVKPDILPFAVMDRDTRFPRIVNVRGQDVAWLYGARDSKAQNADYLVHAANAYPQLVEALRKASEHLWAADEGVLGYGSESDMPKAAQAARAVLRELGEL